VEQIERRRRKGNHARRVGDRAGRVKRGKWRAVAGVTCLS
jgi:hypothetical protein